MQRGPRPGTLAVLALLLASAPACQRPAPAPEQQQAPEAAPAPAPEPAPAPAPAASDPQQQVSQETASPSEPVAAARPLYYDRPLTLDDLQGRTLRELTLMRNTIYARVGQSFRKPWLDQHFRQFDWYAPLPTPDLTRLTAYDFENAQAIGSYERSLSKDDLKAMQEPLLAKKAAGTTSAEEEIELELLAVRLGGWTADPELKPEELSPLADPSQLDQLLVADQLATMSLRDLRLLRNTIYARRGRPFRSPLLSDYFYMMEWYGPDEDYSDAKLTAIDRKNIRLIQSVEKAAGGPLTDYEHKVEEGWFFAA